MVAEARLEAKQGGLEPVSEGWFVVNVRDSSWVHSDTFGDACVFEGEAAPFAGLGLTLGVVLPGEPSGLYHAESEQEDFLVLSGECVLIVEGEERRLRAWDLVHCPPHTEHIFVGAGDGPCVIFMVGSHRGERTIVYPRSELALRHSAGVEQETDSAKEAYAPFGHWQPGRSDGSPALPWS